MPFYLVYTSLPRIEMSRSTLDDITRLSIRKNNKKGITGMLLGIENRYLQYLEGDEVDILELFNRIKQDPRHYEVNKWIQGNTDKRIFSEWSMASWMLSNQEINNLPALKDIDVFLSNRENQEISSTRFIEMMKTVLETWLTIE